MPVLPVAEYPADEKLLRTPSQPVREPVKAEEQLIADMIETMYQGAGAGLAAPQVFVSRRLFVYDVGLGPQAVINPEVLSETGEQFGTESCLSIPRLHGDVRRYASIVVRALDAKGRLVQILAEDFAARVFQHEIDHLNGVLMIDRAVRETVRLINDEEEEARHVRAREWRAQPTLRGRIECTLLQA